MIRARSICICFLLKLWLPTLQRARSWPVAAAAPTRCLLQIGWDRKAIRRRTRRGKIAADQVKKCVQGQINQATFPDGRSKQNRTIRTTQRPPTARIFSGFRKPTRDAELARIPDVATRRGAKNAGEMTPDGACTSASLHRTVEACEWEITGSLHGVEHGGRRRYKPDAAALVHQDMAERWPTRRSRKACPDIIRRGAGQSSNVHWRRRRGVDRKRGGRCQGSGSRIGTLNC